MIIFLTARAHLFAQNYEGHEALIARTEREIELLGLPEDGADIKIDHIFSWNGKDNVVMSLMGQMAIVDLVEDDDGELEIPLDPHGGQEPDAVPIPSAKE